MRMVRRVILYGLALYGAICLYQGCRSTFMPYIKKGQHVYKQAESVASAVGLSQLEKTVNKPGDQP